MELIAGLRKEIMEGIKKFKQAEKEQQTSSKDTKMENVDLKQQNNKLVEANKEFKTNIKRSTVNSIN